MDIYDRLKMFLIMAYNHTQILQLSVRREK